RLAGIRKPLTTAVHPLSRGNGQQWVDSGPSRGPLGRQDGVESGPFACRDRLDRQPMVAFVDHGMIDPEGRSRRGPQMSATPDSAFANPDQRIADLERRLAGCKAEREGALQREPATAEVLQVVNSSPGDLTPVFDAILEKATRICEAVFGTLQTWDGER